MSVTHELLVIILLFLIRIEPNHNFDLVERIFPQDSDVRPKIPTFFHLSDLSVILLIL